MDPFVEAQQVAQKCAAIATRLAELTDVEETFVQTSCALGQPCKPQLTGLIYGPQANRPTVSNLAVGQMTTALCVVTLNPANNTWVCVQPHTDIADPVAACVVLKKIVFPDHLDEGPGGPNARLYAFQVVTYLGSAANLGDVAAWLPIGAVITLAGNISCSRLSLATTNILANMDIQRQGERAAAAAAAAAAAPMGRAIAESKLSGADDLLHTNLLKVQGAYDNVLVINDTFFKNPADGAAHSAVDMASLGHFSIKKAVELSERAITAMDFQLGVSPTFKLTAAQHHAQLMLNFAPGAVSSSDFVLTKYKSKMATDDRTADALHNVGTLVDFFTRTGRGDFAARLPTLRDRLMTVLNCESATEFKIVFDLYLTRAGDPPIGMRTPAAYRTWLDTVFTVDAQDAAIVDYRARAVQQQLTNMAAQISAATAAAAGTGNGIKRGLQPPVADATKVAAAVAKAATKLTAWEKTRPAGIAAAVPICCKAFAKGETCRMLSAGKCTYAHDVPAEVPADKANE